MNMYCNQTLEACDQCEYADENGDCTVDDSEYGKDLTQIFNER